MKQQDNITTYKMVIDGQGFNAGSLPLFILGNDRILSCNSDSEVHKNFMLSGNNDHFVFGTSNDLKNVHGDYEFWLLADNDNLRDESTIKGSILSLGDDTLPNNSYPDEEIISWLNKGRIIISGGTTVPEFKHENFIQCYSLNLWYLYYMLGYHFLNYYPDNINRMHLVGTYWRGIHINGLNIPERDEVIHKVKKLMGSDYINYSDISRKSKYDAVINPHYMFKRWANIPMSTYTDFQHSVASLVYESLGTSHKIYANNNYAGFRDKLSEKTLKALLFSKTNTFTIYNSNPFHVKWLQEHDFWFLNFEFLEGFDKDDIYNEEKFLHYDVRVTVYKACEYLKQLKQKYKTNNDVHKYLCDKYGHLLERNYTNIMKLIDTPKTDLKTRLEQAIIRNRIRR